MFHQLEDALHVVNNNNNKAESSILYSEFKSKLGGSSSGWQELLNLLQFQIDEKADKISFPIEKASEALLCCTGLAEALVGELIKLFFVFC